MTEQTNTPALRFPGFSENWEIIKVRDLSQKTIGGGTPNTSKSNYWKGELNWIQSSDLSLDNLFKHRSKKYINDKALNNSSAKKIPANSIAIVSRVGVGKLVYINHEYATSQDFINLVHLNYPFKFIMYSLYLLLKGEANKLQGTSIKGLTKKDLLNYPLNIPKTIEEQEKIGVFFNKLDRQIELEEEKLELLEQQKRGYMQKIFSQELRFKDDSGNSYPEWESAPLFDIFSATKGKSLSKDKISDDGKYECILYGEIYTTYAEKIESIVSRTNYYEGILSQKNDLIFPNSTTTNAWDLATFSSLQKNNVLIGGDISILRTKRSDISSLFYAYYLTNYLKLRKDIAKYAQGITIVHLSFNNFCKIKVQIPSLEEQNSITDFIDRLNQQQKLITNKIKLLKERKKGFLQKMFI